MGSGNLFWNFQNIGAFKVHSVFSRHFRVVSRVFSVLRAF